MGRCSACGKAKKKLQSQINEEKRKQALRDNRRREPEIIEELKDAKKLGHNNKIRLNRSERIAARTKRIAARTKRIALRNTRIAESKKNIL